MHDAVKVAAMVVARAAVVMALLGAAIFAVSDLRLQQPIVVPIESLAISSDIATIQRGQHLASAVAACTECHGPNLAGKVIADDPRMGRYVAPNLTAGQGGVGGTLNNVDLVRAIRHGLDPAGRGLVIMPADQYFHFGDADLAAIVAYVRSLPAIASSLPGNDIRLVGRVLFLLGQFPLVAAEEIDHAAARAPAPPAAATPEYGRYLADTAGCSSCHGPGLSGGKMPRAIAGAVPATNLTSTGLGTWSEAEFLRVMRTGIRPDGHRLDASMPWPYFAQMSDDELRAIWFFLQVIPARPTGTR